MRKNCEQALLAWKSGKAWRGARSIWSNGSSLYSYNTELVRKIDGRVIVNVTKYSVTTSIHQGALKAALPDAIRFDGVPVNGEIPRLTFSGDC